MKTLVIAEKPSVARDIVDAQPGSFENNDSYYESEDTIVTFAVGHLVELINPEDYDERFKKWRMADLPIVPDEFKLRARDKKAEKQLKVIHKLLARDDVERIVNACDAGREGELIFAYIYETSGVDKPVERLWISSMTKQAIKGGFEKLRPGEQLASLEAAARSRSEADWLVGMNATRAATIRGRGWVGGVVSLGRVQTPTLALIAKREREIQAFVPEPYWLVHAQFDPRYEGLWVEAEETRLTPIGEYAAAAQYVLGLQQLPLARVVNDSKVDDHHAIIPTDVEHDLDRFSPDERRVFDLVARRFLAVFHPPARYARTTVVTLVEEERFRTRGKITLEAGWRSVYGLEPDHERQSEDEEKEGGEIPALQEGQTVRCIAAEIEDKMTRPPPRYTEATLLSAMETAGKLIDDEELREAMKASGLGTPATRAEIIETLIRREYIERVGRDLQPTPKGLQVITMLEEHKITSPELTGDWEHKLSEIEKGKGDPDKFMSDIAGLTGEIVKQIAALDKEKLRPGRVELGPCPLCGAEPGEIIRENSRAYGCTSWKSREEPGCGFVIWKKVAGRTLTPEIARQLIEEGKTREVLSGFKSRAGKPFRARLVLTPEGKVEFDFPARPSRDGDSAETDEQQQTGEKTPAPEAAAAE